MKLRLQKGLLVRAADAKDPICPVTGRLIRRPSRDWKWLFLPILGLVALFWFLVRVLPKPSRAAYPCQRVAAPLASSFLVWLLGVAGSAVAFHNARHLLRKSRYVVAILCVFAGLAAAVVTLMEVPGLEAEGWLPSERSHAPLGTARGVHPGRVAWVRDPAAASWTGGKDSYWWQNQNTDQTVVDSMMSKTVRWLAGRPTDALAWEVLFKHFNQSNGRGSVGYQVGEKIAIKVNLNNSGGMTWGNAQNVSPQVINALLWQLVNRAGVANQADITVCDPSRIIGQPIWDICHAAFPNVRFEDSTGGNGRIRARVGSAGSAIHFGDTNVWSDGARYPATAFTEATYVINLGLLRGHSLAGITACSKNWFGATWVNYDTNAFHHGWTPGGPDPMNSMHGYVAANDCDFGGGNWVFAQRPLGSYNALVDLMGHKDLGGKTMLFLVDGLYGAKDQTDAVPFKWQSAPFNQHWSASLFASQDGVAIESVCLDFLAAEPGCAGTVKGTVDNYLHEAALADHPPSGTLYDPERDGTKLTSLGVHEHWNNATDKQYSRNLGMGNGLELISAPPIEETQDSDHDGALDWEEWIAGTDPTQAASVFRITDFRTTPAARWAITFSSVPGKIYRLWGAATLRTGQWRLVGYATSERGELGLASITANSTATTLYLEPSSTPMFYMMNVQE